jgi:glycosyltransferase involved in cell wall biosynthesis
LRQYLLDRGARALDVVLHPLVPEGEQRHLIEVHERGEPARERRVRLPFRPPYTYPLDLLVPPWPPAVDGWFGFNSLAAGRGLAARAVGRAGTVVNWCVDFVPERFGRGSPVTRAYDALDRLCCRRVDARFELSEAARKGREARHGIPPEELAMTRVVPMGAWLERLPTVAPDAFRRRKVVYLGHLVPRQGVALVVDAIARLRDVTAEIVGSGPLEDELRARAEELGVADRVHFHGFVEDFEQVEAILSEASLAVAPYATDAESFSRFADPGKLKSYLGAGLPILLTDVPPNARELAAEGGAELVDFDPESLATAIERLLGAPDEWRRRNEAALAYARRFDWPVILEPALASLGFTG